MDFEKTQNVINMLQSPDEENQLLGLTVMESIIHADHLIPVLLAFKFGKPTASVWKTEAPLAYNFIRSKLVLHNTLSVTFNDIFEAIVRTKAPAFQMQMFMDMFSKYLTGQCKSLGYTFIDTINITLTKTPEDVNV